MMTTKSLHIRLVNTKRLMIMMIVGLLLLMNLLLSSKNSIATRHTRLRSSILQDEIPHSGCWNDRTSTHKLSIALKLNSITKNPQVEGPVSFKISEKPSP